mgnify:CR=1 FL=1
MRLLAILSHTDKRGTKTEYTKLRKFLLKYGYIRIASEVFMPVVQNRKASEKHYRRIDEVKPKIDVVRLIRLTEKQYNNIYIVTGKPDYQEKIVCVNCHIKDYPKDCVNLQTDVRYNYTVWRYYYGKKK